MDNSNLKERNVIVQVVLLIITLGFYGFYWLVSTNNSLKKIDSAVPSPWTILKIIGLIIIGSVLAGVLMMNGIVLFGLITYFLVYLISFIWGIYYIYQY